MEVHIEMHSYIYNLLLLIASNGIPGGLGVLLVFSDIIPHIMDILLLPVVLNLLYRKCAAILESLVRRQMIPNLTAAGLVLSVCDYNSCLMLPVLAVSSVPEFFYRIGDNYRSGHARC